MGAVILFDGVCNFCDAAVNFVIKRDSHGYFKFAPLQSGAGMKLAAEHGLSPERFVEESRADLIPLDSVVLIEDGKAYKYSTAALRVARNLSGFWPWCYALIIIPAPIRDFLYRTFAKYRYALFGRKDECMLPSPEVRQKFLN